MIKRAIVVVSLLLLAGCGGGGGGSSPAHVVAPTTPPTTGAPTATIRFVIPHGVSTSSAAKGPSYVSPSSASIKVTITSTIPSTVPNPQVTNLTVGAGQPCTVSAGVESCTVTIAAPTGATTYTFDLYDAPNAGGNHLATGTQTITNTVGVTTPPTTVSLSGIVTQVAVSNSASLTVDAPGSTPLSIVPEDADGNAITGSATYANGSLVVTDNDTSGTTGLTLSAPATSGVGTSSVTVTSGANDVIYLNYSGAPSSDPSFTISSTFSSTPPVSVSNVTATLTAFSQSQSGTYSGGSTIGFPAAGGFSATMDVGTPTSSVSGSITTVTTAAAPGEGAPSAKLRKNPVSVRHTEGGGSFEVLAYFEITPANEIIFASQPPAFTVTMPANVVTSGAQYYLAFYDPVTSAWNEAYVGPVSASGDTVTFTPAGSAPFFFPAAQRFDFALLYVPSGNTGPTPTTAQPVNITGTTTCDSTAGCASGQVDYMQQALFFDAPSQSANFGISETGVSNFLVVPLPIGNLSPQSDCVTTPVATASATASGEPATVTATSTSQTGICEVIVIGDELAGSTFWYSNTSASIGLTGKNRHE
ncbi:MAG TPA: hypothetical protein VMD91_03115 [Candidatus Sulfotelmatobacter sp.]|nr:hypothetical protein [Candidatus Sulfotelmatobacter sp.]